MGKLSPTSGAYYLAFWRVKRVLNLNKPPGEYPQNKWFRYGEWRIRIEHHLQPDNTGIWRVQFESQQHLDLVKLWL